MELFTDILILTIFGIPFIAAIMLLLRKKIYKKMYWMNSSTYDGEGSYGCPRKE